MNNVFFIGDLHFGHNNIWKFRNKLGLSSEEEHREFLIQMWNSKVGKRDVVWILGDVAFNQRVLPDLKRLRGQKSLVHGNHDLNAGILAPYFNKIVGLTKYKGYWLSHAPHPPFRASRELKHSWTRSREHSRR